MTGMVFGISTNVERSLDLARDDEGECSDDIRVLAMIETANARDDRRAPVYKNKPPQQGIVAAVVKR